jgi:hypothetical protein
MHIVPHRLPLEAHSAPFRSNGDWFGAASGVCGVFGDLGVGGLQPDSPHS